MSVTRVRIPGKPFFSNRYIYTYVKLNTDTVCPYILATLTREIIKIISGLLFLWCCVRMPEVLLKIISFLLSIDVEDQLTELLSINLSNDYDDQCDMCIYMCNECM